MDPNSELSPQAIAIVIFSYMIVFLIASVFLAIGNYFIAKRLGKTKWLWALLTIIPVVNVVFLYYMMYQIIYGILDRLPPPGRHISDEFK